MEPKVHELKNGLRIVFHPTEKTDVAHCALMMHAGTRNEEKGQEGLAHFIEHMLFKGRTRCDARHLRIDKFVFIICAIQPALG